MTRKEVYESVLQKLDEDKKTAFVAEFRAAKDVPEKNKLLEKYGIVLTKEQRSVLESNSKELSDDDLDMAAGGCEMEWTETPYPCN